MAKGKNKITLYGQEELIREIEKMGGDIEKACEEAITVSGRNATTRYREFIHEHKLTGLTEEALVDNPQIERDGSKIILQTGFDVDKGGHPAIWLDRGSPTQKALKWVQKTKNAQQVKGAIGYVLGKAWRDLM